MEPIIQIKNVTKTFIGKDNQVEALKGISLDINKGDIYGIIGMSGAGKSTLMNILGGVHHADQGQILLDGKRVLLLDDVISTGDSLKALQQLVALFGANIVASAAPLAEGDAADRKDIIYLEKLPLFFK